MKLAAVLTLCKQLVDSNNNNVWLEIAGFIIFAIGFQPETFASPSPTGANPSTKARLAETYGKLPLSFEANQGQTGEQVRFLSRGPGYTVFLTATEAVLSLGRPPLIKAQSSEQSVIPGKAAGRDAESIRTAQAKRDWMPASASMTQAASRDHRDQDTQPCSVLRIQLVGANPTPRISWVDALPGKALFGAPRMQRGLPSLATVFSQTLRVANVALKRDAAMPPQRLVRHGAKPPLQPRQALSPPDRLHPRPALPP